MDYILVCEFFDGFRVYILHNVCVLLFIHRTYGGPSVDVATGCFLRPLQRKSRIDIAIYTRLHS